MRVIAIVGASSAVICATNGFILAGLTVFDSRIIAELHLSNAGLRLRDTITIATLGLSIPVVGHLLDRFPVRPILIGGLLLMAIGFAGYSRVDSLWQIYVLHVLFGLCQATSGIVACVYLVSHWTQAHRGLALGFLMAGSGLGNAIIPALNNALLTHLGWRHAVLSGAVAALVLLPLVLLTVREPGQEGTTGDTAPAASGVSIAALLRSRLFVLLAVTAGTTVFSVLALATNLALFSASPDGAGAGSAALLLFALFGAAVTAQLASGLATYRLDAGLIHGAAVILMFVGVLCFTFAPPALALPAVTLFGLGWGANSTMLQVRPASLFGRAALGRILSILALTETIGGGIGPTVAGYVRDRTGSFEPAFAMVATVMLIPVTFAVVLRVRGRGERRDVSYRK